MDNGLQPLEEMELMQQFPYIIIVQKMFHRQCPTALRRSIVYLSHHSSHHKILAMTEEQAGYVSVL